MFDSPGLKVLSQLGDGGLQNFCGFAERDVFLFVSLRDALQVTIKHAFVRFKLNRNRLRLVSID
jgi:hypothetical protein